MNTQNPYGWLIACDNELVNANIGVAELSHSFDYAKEKLAELIEWHVAVATDPAVNGGFSLQPATQKARVPMTEEKIWASWRIMKANANAGLLMPVLIEMVRAVERAHGIGDSND